MNFIFGKVLLSLLFYADNPYFFTTFFKFLSLLFPYFSVDGHLKACFLCLKQSAKAKVGLHVCVDMENLEYQNDTSISLTVCFTYRKHCALSIII